MEGQGGCAEAEAHGGAAAASKQKRKAAGGAAGGALLACASLCWPMAPVPLRIRAYSC